MIRSVSAAVKRNQRSLLPAVLAALSALAVSLPPAAAQIASSPDVAASAPPPSPSGAGASAGASQPPGTTGSDRAASPQDPFENWNRGVYEFNETIDKAVLKPVATGYRDVVPEIMRGWVGNFFGNFGDAWSSVNHLLQGKPTDALLMGFRVATNTVLGFGGFLDIATEAGIEKKSEDFGQTLGVWGLPSGPYLVLPVLGPSTVRDTGGLTLDIQASPTLVFTGTSDQIGLVTLRLVNTRSQLLDATRMLDEIALDRYQFMRDAYLARRRNQVYDGDPPEATEGDDPVDAPPSAPPIK